MDETRPSPEQILARMNADEKAPFGRGRLKIFLGMSPGVGKTFTMLEAAKKLRQDGIDTVAGCVVTHGRAETENLREGLEEVPPKKYEYKSYELEEMDLDALMVRKPAVALVDELAHTNAPGSRHEKRWQDVEELLNAGIDVYTTVNVQHLESANDIVAQITGIRVRETIPDSIFERAYEVELVDLPPDDLITRLREGKIYMPDHSAKALDNFFRKGNLIALRELALRCTAERVDAQMEKYRRDSSVFEIWPTSDKMLVCVGTHPLSSRLVRATKRMSTALHSTWFAVFIETPSTAKMSQKSRDEIMKTLRMAEKLGGETAVVSGENPVEAILNYAREKNISRIVIGKPAKPRWREILFGSIVDDLIRKSGDIDVYVITGSKEKQETNGFEAVPSAASFHRYLYGLVPVILATVIAKSAFSKLAQVNLAMLYMLAVVAVAMRYGRGPSVMAAILSVAAFDFFFVPPLYSFAVTDTQYVICFAVMVFVGLTLSTMTTTIKRQAELSRMRERHTATMYAMAKDLASAPEQEQVIFLSVQHITNFFKCLAVVFINEDGEELRLQKVGPAFETDAKEVGVAQWVFLNRQRAGIGTSTLPGARALYLPLIGSQGVIGVLGLLPEEPQRFSDAEQLHLLETLVNQMALAVERARLVEKTEKHHLRASTP